MMFQRKYQISIVLLLLSIVLSWLTFMNKSGTHDVENIINNFQKDFEKRENSAQILLDDFYLSYMEAGEALSVESQWVKVMHEKYYQKGVVLFKSRADSVLFLSHNALPVNHFRIPQNKNELYHLGNGWYYILGREHENTTFWLASLVKKDYRFKNRFLINTFQSDYSIPDFFEIEKDESLGYPVLNTKGEYVFSLIVPDENMLVYTRGSLWFLSVVFSILALLTIIYLLYSIFRYYIERRKFAGAVILLFSGLFLTRFVMFYFQVPQCFYQGILFTASHYASSIWLPSLGDLLLNTFFTAVFLFVLFAHRKSFPSLNSLKKPASILLCFISVALIAFAADFVIQLLRSLVINSSLSLDVNFIFSPDIYNILGFIIIAGLFISFYFLGGILLELVSRGLRKSFELFAILVISIIILSVIFYFFGKSPWIIWISLFLSSLIYFIKKRTGTFSISFTRLIISFFVFALAGTFSLLIFNNEKEKANRMNLAMRLASEQDPIAEFLFKEMEEEIFSDTILVNLVLQNPYNESEILQYLKTHYFTEFWAKYDIQLTTCAPGEILYFKHFEQEFVCDDYFDFFINQFGRETLSEHFIYLDNHTGRNSYISIISIKSDIDGQILYNLYVEFEARFIPKELGFPELLVDERIDITRNLGNYSYAVYKDDIMTLKFGSFFYSIHASAYDAGMETFVFFESDGYSHLLYNRDKNTQIMVSKPREGVLERIAPFSYLFITLFLFGILVWALVLKVNDEFSFALNFKKRLQFSIIGIVLISVVAIGSASAWFIFNIYKNKNEAIINEKSHSILIELENILAEEPWLDYTYRDFLDPLLLRLSQVFFTDINLFDPDGALLASSRPRVFDEGLISPLIQPVAFNQLKISGKSLFIHNERIGNLEYISTYVPLRNLQGQLIAYINLPYFAQQSELRNEISYFLVAFINIYLLLLLLSVIIAFFISNYVTRPLQIIRNSISRVTFGKSNKKIDWERNDEIGQLISEYNRMIDELAVSAELLARSERESAWREMAKQVAHEIKNPLTPMRLNVQYLQRAWKDRADDWDERLERFAKTMVEQIDNLAVIAAEFSDFAKMPVAKNDVIDLRNFIPEVTDLFKGFDNVKIDTYMPGGTQPLKVSGDKKQLMRVFNNLIKNAIQAYEKEEIARINVKCEKEENYFKVEIQDFGCGIPDELKKNIFQPYFTTKNAGMGLGLAMVKSIIQSFNGHISFESEQGKGTRFIMRIPAVNYD